MNASIKLSIILLSILLHVAICAEIELKLGGAKYGDSIRADCELNAILKQIPLKRRKVKLGCDVDISIFSGHKHEIQEKWGLSIEIQQMRIEDLSDDTIQMLLDGDSRFLQLYSRTETDNISEALISSIRFHTLWEPINPRRISGFFRTGLSIGLQQQSFRDYISHYDFINSNTNYSAKEYKRIGIFIGTPISPGIKAKIWRIILETELGLGVRFYLNSSGYDFAALDRTRFNEIPFYAGIPYWQPRISAYSRIHKKLNIGFGCRYNLIWLTMPAFLLDIRYDL